MGQEEETKLSNTKKILKFDDNYVFTHEGFQMLLSVVFFHLLI